MKNTIKNMLREGLTKEGIENVPEYYKNYKWIRDYDGSKFLVNYSYLNQLGFGQFVTDVLKTIESKRGWATERQVNVIITALTR